MSDVEGEKPDFEELDLPGEPAEEPGLPELELPDAEAEEPGIPQLDLPGEAPEEFAPVTEDESELPKMAEEDETAESQEDQIGESQPEESEEEPKPESKWPLYAELAGIAAGCLAVIGGTYYAVASSEGLFFWAMLCIYLLALLFLPYVLLKTRNTCTPYRVMLALSLAAILTAVFYLLLELKTYKYDIKAEGAKQRAALIPRVQFGPATTTAADCPIAVQFNTIAGSCTEQSGAWWTT